MTAKSIANQGRGSKLVSRPLKGLAYFREYGHQFRSLGAGRYEGPSRSQRSKRYEINLEFETCDCPDYTRRNPYNTPPDEIRPCLHIYGLLVAVSKPARIPSRERFLFSPTQIESNLARMTGGGFLVEEGESP